MDRLGATTGSDSVLNLSAINAIRAIQRPNGPDLLSRVVNLYRETAPTLLTDLGAALVRKDLDAVRSAAHSLKSSSRNLGADDLAELCEEIESAVRTNELNRLPATADQLDGALDQVLDALTSVTDSPNAR